MIMPQSPGLSSDGRLLSPTERPQVTDDEADQAGEQDRIGSDTHGDGSAFVSKMGQQHRTEKRNDERDRDPQGRGEQGGDQPDAERLHVDHYFRRTRVPLIFWLLSALRKFGTRRSISSKYDDSAGVFCCAL